MSSKNGNAVVATTGSINDDVKQQQQETQKSNFWVGTMVGGMTALTVTSATFAAYMILSYRKLPSNIHITSVSTTSSIPVMFERFSFDWWKHRLAAMIHPTSASSTDMALLQHQQQQAAEAAAAATTATTLIVNTSVQAAVEQFQKELQTQLIHDRNQNTIQFLNTIQQQERSITQTLGQPIYSTKQQVNAMQQQIQALQHIFVSPKSRGTFGEVQLELLIKDVLPSTMYTMQFTLSNKKRVDCMLHLPTPIGNISIDSKFPTLSTTITDCTPTTTDNENVGTIVSTTTNGTTVSPNTTPTLTQQQQLQRKKEVRDKLQKHINDIATKYIIPGETSPHAICFIPSVSLFLEIVTDHIDILLYAHKHHVWLTCPTTLLAVLTTIQGISRGQVVAQQTTNIFALISKLNKDIDLLVNRFDMAEKSIERTRTELSKMQISVHKIQKVKMELDVLSSQTSSSSVLPLQQLPNLYGNDSSDESITGIPNINNQRDDNRNTGTENHNNLNGEVLHHLNGGIKNQLIAITE